MKKPQRWEEGTTGSGRRWQCSWGQLALLGLSQRDGAVGRVLPKSAPRLELCACSLQFHVTSRFQH